MSTPYRESGKEIERRWANPAPRPLASFRRSWWKRLLAWVKDWFAPKTETTIRPVLNLDFPTVPNALDGLAAPVYDLNPDKLHWTDYLQLLEPYVSPHMERYTFYYRWMREMDKAMLAYQQRALEVPKEFLDDSLKPGPAEQELVAKMHDEFMRYSMICMAPMYYARITVMP